MVLIIFYEKAAYILFLLVYFAYKYIKNDNTCLDARVNLSKCYKTNTDFGACDDFVDVFEQCVKKAVIQKSAKP